MFFLFSSILKKIVFLAIAFALQTNLVKPNALAIDRISSIIDKIEKQQNSGTQAKNNKNANNDNKKNPIKEKYAGMVGDKSLGKGLNLELIFEQRGTDEGLLVINGNGVGDDKRVKTFLASIPAEQQEELRKNNLPVLKNKFYIDVYFNTTNEKNNVVNFTYQMPKEVRLKYGQQQFGYRIAIEFFEDVNIAHQYKKNNEIAIKFRKKLLNNNITSQNKNEKNNIIQNERILKHVSSNATFNTIAIKHKKPIIVAIDAGHGGIDCGAMGKRKTAEKTLTLMYAKRLKEVLISKGFKVVMIRDTDKTVPLIKRVQTAKNANADIFLSLHMDAHTNTKISGTTVYRLSNLDQSHPDWDRFHNKSYLPDVYANINNSNVLDILIGLTHQTIAEKSSILVDNILLSMKNNGFCKICRHGQRSLAVLRGLDMVSVLIEIGYITNPEEEKKLLSASHVEQFAKNIANTIEKTFFVEEKSSKTSSKTTTNTNRAITTSTTQKTKTTVAKQANSNEKKQNQQQKNSQQNKQKQEVQQQTTTKITGSKK